MSLLLNEVMELKSLEGAELLAGGMHKGFEVTGITIMEAPDIASWMKRGQILLSSLYSIGQSDIPMEDFVRELAEKNISALMIKMRNSKISLDSLVRLCEKHGLTLVKIPEETPYTNITYEVMAKLFDIHLSRANYFRTCHDTFMKIALNAEGVDAIVHELCQMVHRAVTVCDNDGTVLSSSLPEIKKGMQVTWDGGYVRYTTGNIAYYEHCIRCKDVELCGIAAPIKALKRTQGILFVENKKALGEFEWIAIENAITVLNLEMTKRLAVEEIEQKFKNDLIDDLLTSHIKDEAILYERAKIIGWDFKNQFLAAVFKIEIPKSEYDKAAFDNSGARELQVALEQIIAQNTGGFSGQSIVRVMSQTLIALLPCTKGRSHEKNIEIAKQIAFQFQEECTKKLGITAVSCGIGETQDNVYSIAKSYSEALDSLQFGNLLYGKNSICDFQSLGVYRLLCKCENKDELWRFIPASMQKLIDYDKAENDSLLHTLDVYLQHDCNANKASKELYIHYKTLVYRIAKIKNIMGVEQFEGDTRLELQIGMKIFKLSN